MMADYIRREDALKLLSDDIPICGASLYQAGAKGGLQIAHGIVAAIPAADVAPVVHGKWVLVRRDNSSGQFDIVKCYRCGLEAYAMAYHVRDGNYCPSCGALMDGRKENDP